MEMTVLTEPVTNECECQPLVAMGPQREDHQPMTPVTPELAAFLRAELAGCFPRLSPISLLLLHISQLERAHISPQSVLLHKRRRFHAPRSFLEQALANMRRGIRGSDHIIVHGGAGAAIIFPGVDREGAFSIMERIYNSINLLQPETVIPPLAHETDIFVGMSSYPEPATSLEMLLHQASYIVHRLTLRPAVNAQFFAYEAVKAGEARHYTPPGKIHLPDESTTDEFPARNSNIPFMQLPGKLPARLRHLIPYRLASELRCAPVGRNHNRITVAMAQPVDEGVLDLLRETTGMAIYPVACEKSALDALLAKGW